MQLQTCSGKPSHDEHQAPASHAPWTQRQTRIYAGQSVAHAPPQSPTASTSMTWTAPVRSTSRSSFYCCAALRACVGRGRASYLSIHRKPIPCLLPHALGSSLLAHPFKSRPHIHHTHRGRLGARRALFNPFLPWLARLLIYYGYKYITGSHVHKMSVHLGSLPHGSCLATSLSHSLTIALSRL
jgi:hypothetical protein